MELNIWILIGIAVLGLAAIMLEVFVPAGGVIGVIGGIAMIASVVLVYTRVGPAAGTVFLVACLILAPVVIVVAFRFFPQTYVGRRLIMGNSQTVDTGYHSADPELAALAGKEGEALTMLRPAGMARFDGKRVSVVTDGELIEKGTKVRVVEVEGGRVVVERV